MHHAEYLALSVAPLSISVLSSSSRGNCSALLVGTEQHRQLWLIDAGLSPRRTHALLAQVGLGDLPIAGALLTHLDHDHWNTGWLGAMPEKATVHIHRSHRGRADRAGLTYLRTNLFDDDFELTPGILIRPILNAHDDLGAAAFRIEFAHNGASLGFATDIGSTTRELAQHLSRVDVLAVESNYCPEMQLASSRPKFLKDRIMGGGGHLSNHQSAKLVRQVAPRSHVVLLHLSLDCNTPDKARCSHDWSRDADAPACTIASWDGPTPWINIKPGNRPAREPLAMPRSLWECVNQPGA